MMDSTKNKNAPNKLASASQTGIGNFFEVRNSFDKVISYDTSSLLEALHEKENNGRNSNRGHATVIPKLRRPMTGSNTPKVGISVNERFNQKLIEHGTEIGVPASELPDPSSLLSS